jgi:chromosome segregation ATPase
VRVPRVEFRIHHQIDDMFFAGVVTAVEEASIRALLKKEVARVSTLVGLVQDEVREVMSHVVGSEAATCAGRRAISAMRERERACGAAEEGMRRAHEDEIGEMRVLVRTLEQEVTSGSKQVLEVQEELRRARALALARCGEVSSLQEEQVQLKALQREELVRVQREQERLEEELSDAREEIEGLVEELRCVRAEEAQLRVQTQGLRAQHDAKQARGTEELELGDVGWRQSRGEVEELRMKLAALTEDNVVLRREGQGATRSRPTGFGFRFRVSVSGFGHALKPSAPRLRAWLRVARACGCNAVALLSWV